MGLLWPSPQEEAAPGKCPAAWPKQTQGRPRPCRARWAGLRGGLGLSFQAGLDKATGEPAARGQEGQRSPQGAGDRCDRDPGPPWSLRFCNPDSQATVPVTTPQPVPKVLSPPGSGVRAGLSTQGSCHLPAPPQTCTQSPPPALQPPGPEPKAPVYPKGGGQALPGPSHERWGPHSCGKGVHGASSLLSTAQSPKRRVTARAKRGGRAGPGCAQHTRSL